VEGGRSDQKEWRTTGCGNTNTGTDRTRRPPRELWIRQREEKRKLDEDNGKRMIY